jgi:hypothetical protein
VDLGHPAGREVPDQLVAAEARGRIASGFELVRWHGAVIMPRILGLCALGFVGGCVFSADYGGSGIHCSDGRCPDGLTCRADQTCGPPLDAASDDAPRDARLAALTCSDPGVLPATGGTATGTTVGRTNTVSASCAGFVMNGKDAIYRIDVPAGATLLVDVAGGRKAYVLPAASCVAPPTTPACVGDTLAVAGNPLSVMPAAGNAFVVIDDENPASASTYTLTVTVN